MQNYLYFLIGPKCPENVPRPLKQKVSFLFSLNEMIPFLYIVLMKARREITTIILKIASSLLSRKYGNKDDQQVQKVSNYLRTMLEPIFILTLLII